MADIFINVSKFISSDYMLIKHSALTQSLIGSSTTILWNDNAFNIDESTYNKFKDALKKRGSKFYIHNDILPYPDFCVALLCTNNYNLNHISTPSISARTYTAAWRSLHIVSSIAEPCVKEWMSSYMLGRTAFGYSVTHGIQLDSSLLSNTLSNNKNKSPQLIEDEYILEEALNCQKIKTISHSNRMGNGIGMLASTPTPECQLGSLQIYHDILITGYIKYLIAP